MDNNINSTEEEMLMNDEEIISDENSLQKNNAQEMNYYKVVDEFMRVDYYKELIRNIASLNKEVEVNGQWFCLNKTNQKITIISSVPLENLKMPEGYYGNVLNNKVFPETKEEYEQSINGEYLKFDVSKDYVEGFSQSLGMCNPEANISLEKDEKNMMWKISSSIPFGELRYSEGYYTPFGLDKDGYIANLGDRIVDFKNETILDNGIRKKQYIETTQHYFDSISYLKMKEDENEREMLVQEELETEEFQINEVIELSPEEELTQMAREDRKFTILQRERAMSDAQKAKLKSALIAGGCFLGASINSHFSGLNFNTVMQQQLELAYSWDTLGAYVKDLGPMTTMLTVSGAVFFAKYFADSNKFKKAQNEFIDFNASLENTETLGGNENARTR